MINLELTVEEILKIMKQFLESIEQEYAELLEELSIKEAEQQDLLHELELNNLNAVEISKVAIQLRQVRRDRRIIKNDIERMKLIKNFTDKQNNRFVGNEIKVLLKELYKLKDIQGKRKYEPRILKNHKIGGKQC